MKKYSIWFEMFSNSLHKRAQNQLKTTKNWLKKIQEKIRFSSYSWCLILRFLTSLFLDWSVFFTGWNLSDDCCLVHSVLIYLNQSSKQTYPFFCKGVRVCFSIVVIRTINNISTWEHNAFYFVCKFGCGIFSWTLSHILCSFCALSKYIHSWCFSSCSHVLVGGISRY